MRTVRDCFKQFGPDVVDALEAHMDRHQDLSRLLQKFGLTAPNRLEQQQTALANFIFKYGIAFFLKAVKSDLTPAQIETLKAQRLVNYSDMHGRASHEKQVSPAADGSAGHPRHTATPGHGMQSILQPVQPVQPALPTAQPRHGDTVNGRKWIVSDTYVGPDRRSGRDRRKGPRDRRGTVATVYKNRRYGGRDRRKALRRAEDREKQAAVDQQESPSTQLPDARMK